MKIKIYSFMALLAVITAGISFISFVPDNAKPMLKEEVVTYMSEGVTLKGFVVYDQNRAGKRPAILVVHEWWGLNDYAKNRARQLASLGYIAMAVDMYGGGITASNPQQAQEMATPFYENPQLAKIRLDAALNKVKEFKQADVTNVAAIGYCFGGSVVLNSAKLGADLKGVVSFHGGLKGVPAKKELLNAKILVCHGEADKFVTEKDINNFKHELDSISADYTFKTYANATHAFTNPDATNTGKQFNMPIEYNEAADKASWTDMQTFLVRIFKK